MKTYLDPTKLDPLRRMAGMPPAKYTVYYNLAGPEKNCAVGRIDHKDVFVVEMENEEYEKLLKENNHFLRESYLALYEIYRKE